tara:strand:- start:2132 stop:2725 length:594 start_codon:yes stop_codon:yes gene_type:complete
MTHVNEYVQEFFESIDFIPLTDKSREEILDCKVKQEDSQYSNHGPTVETVRPYRDDRKRKRDNSYKINLCKFYEIGYCREGSDCKFAHGWNDQRKYGDSVNLKRERFLQCENKKLDDKFEYNARERVELQYENTTLDQKFQYNEGERRWLDEMFQKNKRERVELEYENKTLGENFQYNAKERRELNYKKTKLDKMFQ